MFTDHLECKAHNVSQTSLSMISYVLHKWAINNNNYYYLDEKSKFTKNCILVPKVNHFCRKRMFYFNPYRHYYPTQMSATVKYKRVR